MAINDSGTRNQYTATASQTVFAYTFEIFVVGDITVKQNAVTLSEGTHYTVSGVGSDSGGNVTLVTGATSGDAIDIYRDMAFERLTDYLQNGDFLADDVNNDFDRLWAALQQNENNITISNSANRFRVNLVSFLLETTSGLTTSSTVEFEGHTTAGDGGGAVWRHNGVTGQTVSQSPSDLNSYKLNDASGNQWELISPASVDALGVDTITIDIPTEFADLQAALDYFSGFTHKSDQEIVLNFATGFEIVTATEIDGVELSFVRVTSTDAEVTVGATMPTSDIIKGFEAKMPILDCLIDANGEGRYGYSVQACSYGEIKTGAGIKNTVGRGLYINNNAKVLASGSIFTGAGSINTDSLSRGAWVARGSTLICESADFSNSADTGIYISRASTVHGMGVTVTGAVKQAIWCHRSSRCTVHYAAGFNTTLSTHSTSTSDVIKADRTSIVSANGTGVTITQSGSGNGVLCTGASSINVSEATINGSATSDAGIAATGAGTVDASNAIIDGFNYNIEVNVGEVAANSSAITGARAYGVFTKRGSVALASASVTGSTTLDINCLEGSTVWADGCTTTSGVGTPNLTDCNVTAFNAITGSRGVVWS